MDRRGRYLQLTWPTCWLSPILLVLLCCRRQILLLSCRLLIVLRSPCTIVEVVDYISDVGDLLLRCGLQLLRRRLIWRGIGDVSTATIDICRRSSVANDTLLLLA